MHEHSSISSHSSTIQPILTNAAFNKEAAKENIYTESLSRLSIQRKLSVGAPDDPLEDEADAMADRVMRMPENNFIQHQYNSCNKLIQKQDENTTPAGKDKSWSNMQQQLANPDFLKLRTPFLERGVPHLWDPDAALNVYKTNFIFFKQTLKLPDDLAAKAANFTAPLAIYFQLKADNPNLWDISDKELKTSSKVFSVEMFNFGSDFKNWKFLPFLQKKTNDHSSETYRSSGQTFIQKKCAHCEEEERAQRKPLTSFIQKKQSLNNNVVASDNVSNQIQSTKGIGNAMSATTKNFMESRFGADFSSVKIHTGNYASQLSKDLHAQAFTVGNNIYFSEGRYQPESTEGKHLLAHELTHTIQQGHAGFRNVQKQDDDVAAESEAMGDRFREERRRDLHRIIECNEFYKIRRDCPASTGVRLADVLARMRTRIAGNQACLRFFRSRFNINPDIMLDPSRRPSITFDPNLRISGLTRCPEPTCDSPIPSVSIGSICNSPHLERVIMHELTHYAHCYRRWGDTGDEATSEQASNICIGTVQQALDAARGRTTTVQPKLMRVPERNFIQRKCAHCEEEEKVQRKPLTPFIQKKDFKSTGRANEDTPELINDTVIKSSLLAKYVGADRVKAAFLDSKNFHVIQDYELKEYGDKCKQGDIVDKAGGFFCRNVAKAKDKDLRGDIFVVRYLKLGYVIHEFMHKLSGPTVKNMLGTFVNEGITQYFTDQFLTEGKYDILTDHGYIDNLACANKIVSQTNEQMVADAYFNNNTKLINVLQKLLHVKTINDVKPYLDNHQCIP